MLIGYKPPAVSRFAWQTISSDVHLDGRLLRVDIYHVRVRVVIHRAHIRIFEHAVDTVNFRECFEERNEVHQFPV